MSYYKCTCSWYPTVTLQNEVGDSAPSFSVSCREHGTPEEHALQQRVHKEVAATCVFASHLYCAPFNRPRDGEDIVVIDVDGVVIHKTAGGVRIEAPTPFFVSVRSMSVVIRSAPCEGIHAFAISSNIIIHACWGYAGVGRLLATTITPVWSLPAQWALSHGDTRVTLSADSAAGNKCAITVRHGAHVVLWEGCNTTCFLCVTSEDSTLHTTGTVVCESMALFADGASLIKLYDCHAILAATLKREKCAEICVPDKLGPLIRVV